MAPVPIAHTLIPLLPLDKSKKAEAAAARCSSRLRRLPLRLPSMCSATASPVRAQGRVCRFSSPRVADFRPVATEEETREPERSRRDACMEFPVERPVRAARGASGTSAQVEQSAPLLPGPVATFLEKSAPPRWPSFMASPDAPSTERVGIGIKPRHQLGSGKRSPW